MNPSQSGPPPTPINDKSGTIVRRELNDRFGVAPLAASHDGHTVHIMAPVDHGLQSGGFALVRTGVDGSELVVQMREVQLVERAGPQLDLAIDDGPLSEAVRSASVQPRLRSIAGVGTVLGTLDAGAFMPTGTAAPFADQQIRPAESADVAAIFAGLDRGAPAIEIGVLHQMPDVPCRLQAKAFARHTFMCGQSGSGKTYTTGVLFERLLANTTLPLVVLDPNSDHVHLGSLRDPDDHSEAAESYRTVASGVQVARARGFGGAITLCADFSDLNLEMQALLLRLDPIHDAIEFENLRRVTASLVAPFSIEDVVEAAETDPDAAGIVRRIQNLGVADWDLWRRGDEPSIADVDVRSQRCVVFDLGSLQRPDERTVVALALLGRRWSLRGERTPVLIAIDEAHNVLPAQPANALLAATTELGILIAGEGRKYGLHLFVATQRPSKVHANVVSQCDNLVLMRMNGTADIEDLTSLFSHVPAALVRESATFGLGQALVAGPIAPVPMIAQVGTRLTPEGGADVPTTWATPPA